MSPRSYRLGEHKIGTENTRSRIVAAARELLVAEGGFSGFTVDAVARRAGVARMTVYYQFGSKAGLLEAIYDDLAAHGRIGEGLADAFQREDPLQTLAGFIEAFARFWASDQLVLRRLQGLSALDPDFEQGGRARGQRRREGARQVVARLAQQEGWTTRNKALEEAIDILYMLTSFETFDSLAGEERSPEDVAPIVRLMACAALEFGPGLDVARQCEPDPGEEDATQAFP